jgi:hypothetical protein
VKELNIIKLKLYMLHMFVPWGVVTSHTRSISGKIYWKLTNIALVNDAIHEKVNKGREDSHSNILCWTSFMIVSPH